MARTDPPIYKTKVKRDDVREAKKGDVETIDGEDWESIGEKSTGPKGELESNVDEGELTSDRDPKTGRLKGGALDDIRTKDSEGGKRREYFKRKPEKPVS